MEKCNFCDKTIYFKTIKYTKSLLAPITRAEELRQRLEDLTGEIYVPLTKRYCPMCGNKLSTEDKND